MTNNDKSYQIFLYPMLLYVLTIANTMINNALSRITIDDFSYILIVMFIVIYLSQIQIALLLYLSQNILFLRCSLKQQ